jgi:hypothetical protein
MCVISMVLAVWTGAAIMVMVVVMAMGGARELPLQQVARTAWRAVHAQDCPRIGDFDELLEALRLHHGPEGRPDLQPIPRTTMTPNP